MFKHSSPFLFACSLMVLATSAFAGVPGNDCKGKGCPEKPRDVCFNVFCRFEPMDAPACEAAANFTKRVHEDGSEMEDESPFETSPRFEVQCDDHIIYNNHGHRFTDWKGTRIQAETGPYPALTLPKGALRDDHQLVPAWLELGEKPMRGTCYVYTGQQ